MYLEERQTSGTGAGNSAATTWNPRTLTDVVFNNIAGASLVGGRARLPAGSYIFDFSAPATSPAVSAVTQYHQTGIQNIDDASQVAVGESCCEGQNQVERTQTHSRGMSDVIVIAAQKDFELQHYTSLAVTNGLGLPATTGAYEVYGRLKITKVA
jgi:hypothetical protein